MALPVKILLIDDDSDDYLIVRDLLNDIDDYDFRLTWAKDYELGFRELDDNNFDICLVDLSIGAHNGISFIREARLQFHTLPFIVVTGFSDRRFDLEAAEAGASDFIEKSSLCATSLERSIRYAINRKTEKNLHELRTAVDKSGMVDQLRRAISEDQFEAYLQPQVHCETGEITGAEALVRWNHPERGVLGPGHFIDLAEQSGFITDISDSVMKQVCQFSSRLRIYSSDLRIAFNVSIAQLERLDFADAVKQTLVYYNADPSAVELEITESVATQEPKLVQSHMDALKKFGIRFAIDDFGTGHSGLATLKDFPFDIIKIDRTFVQSAEHSFRNRAIAKTIFYLADVMRLETVAEGVETEAQLSFVRNYGATQAQGYYFGRPMRYPEFERLLRGMGQVPSVWSPASIA